MNHPNLTAQGQVDGLPIWVFDDLVEKKTIDEIYQALMHAPFTRSEISRPDTEIYRHWAYNMPLDKALQLPIYQATQKQLNAHTERNYRMYRCYCNLVSYGDILFNHTDCQPGTHEMTALWYIQDQWDVEWGGETLFFNARDDASYVASPRPGRLVIFDGSIKHKGTPPSKICTLPRLTFAMKFEIAPQT